jgi:hypothetical protein
VGKTIITLKSDKLMKVFFTTKAEGNHASSKNFKKFKNRKDSEFTEYDKKEKTYENILLEVLLLLYPTMSTTLIN